MRPSSAKAKGRRLQQRAAADLVTALGLEPDDVVSRSTGANGTDLLLSPAAQAVFPFAVECKNTERLNVWAAWAQAMGNAGHRLPLVLAARNRTEPLAIVRWSDLLRLVAGQGGPGTGDLPSERATSLGRLLAPRTGLPSECDRGNTVGQPTTQRNA